MIIPCTLFLWISGVVAYFKLSLQIATVQADFIQVQNKRVRKLCAFIAHAIRDDNKRLLTAVDAKVEYILVCLRAHQTFLNEIGADVCDQAIRRSHPSFPAMETDTLWARRAADLIYPGIEEVYRKTTNWFRLADTDTIRFVTRANAQYHQARLSNHPDVRWHTNHSHVATEGVWTSGSDTTVLIGFQSWSWDGTCVKPTSGPEPRGTKCTTKSSTPSSAPSTMPRQFSLNSSPAIEQR